MIIIKANHFLSTNNLIKNQVRTVVPYILEQLTNGKIIKVKKINQQSKKRLREEWQDVKPKGEEKELRKIKEIELNDRLKSRPKDAQDMARRKLQSLKTSLMHSGFCRETKPYNPPANVTDKIKEIHNELFGHNNDWGKSGFTDSTIKFKMLTKCEAEFNHEVPNSILDSIRTVSDLIEFYSTPVRGVNSYDELVKKQDALPRNLNIIPSPLRYNEESDHYFGGINAYPHSALQVKDLHSKRKYPSFKSTFIWPDV